MLRLLKYMPRGLSTELFAPIREEFWVDGRFERSSVKKGKRLLGLVES
jgi:hypothetical protein